MKTYILQTIRSTSTSKLLEIGHKFEKCQWRFKFRYNAIVILFWCCRYFSSSLVTGPSFTSTSLLVLELWQFSSIKGWPEIWKSKIHPSEFCLTSGERGKLGIPLSKNLSRMSLMKCYWMLQNARFTAFTFSELLRKS